MFTDDECHVTTWIKILISSVPELVLQRNIHEGKIFMRTIVLILKCETGIKF
jgi:hypothetical protein